MEPALLEHVDGRVDLLVDQLREALGGHRLVVVRGSGAGSDPRAFWDEVTESLGSCVLLAEDSTTGRKLGEKWMEIRYDPAFPNAYRHSREAQPLHTDGSYLRDAPEVISFYCLRQAPSGGETVFIDGPELVHLLRDEEPEFLRKLESTPVTFSKADESKRRPIVETDAAGPRLTWNYFTVDPGEPSPTRDLAQRFHRFLEDRVVAAGRLVEVLLAPGDAVFFHDERMLHGRNAFVAERRDERFFWKTGFRWA